MFVLLVAGLIAACGTDFVEPAPVGARADTPAPQATVFRVISVTPVATPTPLPAAVGPDGSVQRLFPAEIDPDRAVTGQSSADVINYWKEYLSGARLIVAARGIDIHLCADGDLIPSTPATGTATDSWGFRSSTGEWYEVILGRELQRSRISGIVTLSRVGESTVALDGDLNVVSVTDSELCANTGGL